MRAAGAGEREDEGREGEQSGGGSGSSRVLELSVCERAALLGQFDLKRRTVGQPACLYLRARKLTRWALIFLRRPLKLLAHALPHQQRQGGSVRAGQCVATHRPAGSPVLTRRVAKNLPTLESPRNHSGITHPHFRLTQAKTQRHTSGPRWEPITANSTPCGAIGCRPISSLRRPLIGQFAPLCC
jgi:hypothetical protein